MQPSFKKQIQRIVTRIVKQFDPDRIILFGSHARNQAGPDSDIDLLIVMPVKGSLREKCLEVRHVLHDIPVPKDVVISTPEDFEWRKEVIGTIEYPAWREGKILYVREGKHRYRRPRMGIQGRK